MLYDEDRAIAMEKAAERMARGLAKGKWRLENIMDSYPEFNYLNQHERLEVSEEIYVMAQMLVNAF